MQPDQGWKEGLLLRDPNHGRAWQSGGRGDGYGDAYELKHQDNNYRLVSREGEIPFANYLRLDNSELTPEEAAEKIREYFGL